MSKDFNGLNLITSNKKTNDEDMRAIMEIISSEIYLTSFIHTFKKHLVHFYSMEAGYSEYITCGGFCGK